MATETWRVLQHETANGSDLQNTMIGILDAADATLGYRGLLWKDGAGTVQQALAKDELASTLDLTLGDTTGVAKIIHGGDTDTYLAFEADKLTIRAGGANAVVITEGATDKIDLLYDVKIRNTYIVSDEAGLLTAITAIGTGGEVVVTGAIVLTANLSIDISIILSFSGAGSISTDSGTYTLSVGNMRPAAPVQVFVGSGVTFARGAVPYVMPEWWGADATGAADSTNAINYAILSLLNTVWTQMWSPISTATRPTSGGGKVIFATGGTYKTTAPVNIYAGIEIDGNFCELKFDSGATPAAMMYTAAMTGHYSKTGYLVRRITLDGSSVATAGLHMLACDGSVFDHIQGHHCSQNLLMETCQYNTLINCHWGGAVLDNIAIGADPANPTLSSFMNTFIGGQVQRAQQDGLSVTAACETTFHGTTFGYNARNEMRLVATGNTQGNSFFGCHIEHEEATSQVYLGVGVIDTRFYAPYHARAGTYSYNKWYENNGTNTLVSGLATSVAALKENPAIVGDYSIIQCDGGNFSLELPHSFSEITTPYGYATDSAGAVVKGSRFNCRKVSSSSYDLMQHEAIADAVSSYLMRGSIVGEAQNRFRLNAAGKISIGDGTSAPDTDIERSTAATVKISDKLWANTKIGCGAAPTVQADFYDAASVIYGRIQTNMVNGGAYWISKNDVQDWRVGTHSDDTYIIKDATGGDIALAIKPTSLITTFYGNVGLSTTVPLTNVGTAAGDFTGTGLHVKGTAETYLIVEGNAAHIVLCDTDGATNDKDLELIVDGGVAAFRALNDATTVRTDNILVMDLGTGYTGFGIAAAASRIHAYVDSALDMTAADGVILNLEQDNASGDAAIGFEFTGGQRYSIGIDVSNSNHPLVVYDVTDSVWYMSFVTGSITIAPASDIDTTWGCTGPATLCRMDWGLGFTHYPDSRGVSFGTDPGTSPDGKIYSDGTNLKIDTTGYAQFSGVLNVEAGKRVACGGGSTGSAATAIGTVTLQIGNQLYTLPFTAVTSI